MPHRCFLSLILAIVLFIPVTAHSCPLCKEAIATPDSEEVEEINNLPTAYNRSIYLMVSMPYLLLGGVGFMIYRGRKQNSEVGQTFLTAVEQTFKP